MHGISDITCLSAGHKEHRTREGGGCFKERVFPGRPGGHALRRGGGHQVLRTDEEAGR